MFGVLNLVRDAVALVSALGLREVAMVAGHDYGSGVASACALVRPDVFRSVALMRALVHFDGLNDGRMPFPFWF